MFFNDFNQACARAVFFNLGSAEPRGSANSFLGSLKMLKIVLVPPSDKKFLRGPANWKRLKNTVLETWMRHGLQFSRSQNYYLKSIFLVYKKLKSVKSLDTCIQFKIYLKKQWPKYVNKFSEISILLQYFQKYYVLWNHSKIMKYPQKPNTISIFFSLK